MSPEQIAKLKSYWGTGSAGGAVSELAERLSPRKYGNIPLYRRPVAEIIGEKVMNSIWLLFTVMVVFWYSLVFPRRSRRKKRGWDHGPDRDGIFPVCGQHPGILGGKWCRLWYLR